ncbi:IS4 family transposase [Candidatus Cardinium sp. TP]|nr:IS4 family transposase [Candidatus Cardinium sp. TP]
MFQRAHAKGKNIFTRKRKLTFPIVFSTILHLVKRSLGIECELMEPLSCKIPPSKQAFSKAKYKFAHTGFKELLQDSMRIAYQEDPNYGTWKTYRLIAVDGSSIRLPVSSEIISQFGRFKPNGTNGTMPPLARVSLFVDLCTSLVCNARLAPWNVGEETLAASKLPEVIEQMRALNQDKLLFIYDRGYTSVKFIKQHNDSKVDFIFRVQGNSYKKLWKRVESGEADFDCIVESKDKSISQQVRVVAFRLSNGKREVLITSLFDREQFTLESISKAYALRWHIEECYKRLKVSAELENFSGTHLEAVLQEFWAHLVMCNLLALHMCDAQGPWNPERIAEYRLNFSVLFGVMSQKMYQVLIGKYEAEHLQKLFDTACIRAKVKIRTGRVYTRDKVDKPKQNHVFRRVC